MLLVRSLIFDAALYGTLAVLGILGLPFAAWSRGGAYAVMKLVCRIGLWLLRQICGLEVEVRGEVPDGDVIVCAKHQSLLDILVMTHVLARPQFVMKRELRWAPIVGLYALRTGSAPVARGQRSQAMAEMVAHARREGGMPRQLIIYPQGTRVMPGAELPYKIGAGVLYDRLGQVCVPVATNTGVFWGRRSFYRRPGTAVIEFLPPIAPGMPIKRFMVEIERVVEGESNRLMREAGFEPGPAQQSAKHVAPLAETVADAVSRDE